MQPPLIDDEARSQILAGKPLPPGRIGRLDFTAAKDITGLPAGLHCHTLILDRTSIAALPPDLRVDFKLDVSGCANLQALPNALSVPVLRMRNCAAMVTLPEHLTVDYLDAEGCTALEHCPETVRIEIGNVSFRGCARLLRIPANLGPIASLDICGCRSLNSLPEGARVRSWVDLADTSITSLPPSLGAVPLRWKGVGISHQIAFRPETLDSATILAEPNAEVRRVMIERFGMERFLTDSQAETLHEDRDAGGRRRLLRVPLAGDEDIVCVSVTCPSTGRHYFIRVPPGMKTCHQAVAWTAGFDDPDDYRPVAET